MRKMLNPKIDDERGLTLIELVIVLALLSVVIAGLFQLFSFVYHSWERVESESFKLQEVRLAFDMLGKDIQNAPPMDDNGIGASVRYNGIAQSSGNELLLGPDRQGQIRYWINDNKLCRQEKSATGDFFDSPGAIVEIADDDDLKPFELNGRVVKITLKVSNRSELKSKPKEFKAEFTVRNGQDGKEGK